MRIEAEARRCLDANGLRVGYDVVGDGRPLVLLHGASSTGREDFGAQLPRLRHAFTCYLPDARLFVVPGCGHEVPAKRPGLFTEGLTGFYRSIGAGR